MQLGSRHTRGTAITLDGAGVSPARSNSLTSGGTAAQLAFIASASGRVTKFQTNSRVARALCKLSLAPMLQKPMIGGV